MESIIQKVNIDIHEAGNNCHIRFGDLTGDGTMDILLVKADRVSDERYFSHRVICATAFSYDGTMLWQFGDSEYDSPNVRCEIPAQIYDIDRDGKNEVIIIFGEELLILDGKTAEVKKSIPLPDKNACDSISFADLDGTGYAGNIIIKNKFSQMWAFDRNQNILWTFHGNLGHAPAIYDINGDGREEVIAGYNVLTSGGELLWKITMPTHANSVTVCKKNDNSAPIIIFSGETVVAYSAEGKPLWEIQESAQSIAVGNFSENSKENEILLLDDMSLFDFDGNFILQKNEVMHTTAVISNFDADNKNYIIGHKPEDVVTTLYDGFMRSKYTFNALGKIACCDFLGNGISQVVIYTDDSLDIFFTDNIDFENSIRPYTRIQPKQYYNTSAYNILPFSQFTSGYIAEDFAAQNILKWAENYANINMQNSFIKVIRSEFIQLLITILNLNEDFIENFADVESSDNYYQAVGTARALGIIESEDNMFLPDTTVTVTYANAVLEKLNIDKCFNFDPMYELSKQDLARLILSLKEQ